MSIILFVEFVLKNAAPPELNINMGSYCYNNMTPSESHNNPVGMKEL